MGWHLSQQPSLPRINATLLGSQPLHTLAGQKGEDSVPATSGPSAFHANGEKIHMPLCLHPNHFREAEQKVMKEKVREGKPERREKRKWKGVGKKMEIICPPNSWSKTHSSDGKQLNSSTAGHIHEVNAKKPTSSEKGKQVTLQICPLRSLKSQTANTQALWRTLTSHHALMPHCPKTQKLFKVSALYCIHACKVQLFIRARFTWQL